LARYVGVGAVLALMLWGIPSDAGGGHKGSVRVTGKGDPIRVLVAGGFKKKPASCDGGNKLVDQQMGPGQRATFQSPDKCVCVQQSKKGSPTEMFPPDWECAKTDLVGRTIGGISIELEIQ
jgi:hypothetical protein